MDSVRSADGTVLSVHTSGHGPALLLVHGTSADHTRWSGVAPELEKRFSVFYMDRRGRGDSGDGPSYHVMREAEDVASVVEAIGQPVRILGHSYGALCAMEAALLTDEIARMVLYEPPIPTGVTMYADGVPDRMQGLLDAGEPERALEVFFREVVRMPEEELDAYRRLPMWQQRIKLAPTIPREMAIDRTYVFEPEKFAGLDIPVGLYLGGDSPELFRSAVATAEAALPNATIVVLPGQQHVAMDTDPDLFLREVFRFLLDG
ncbi:MAG TPA: alpha/beta hydrolase [Acidimicrobiia bacterium]|nr:alpha/beta hydrolase [Acidimicrobiia bacterium]